MKCEYCENTITEEMSKCPCCGAPIAFPNNTNREQQRDSSEKNHKDIAPLQLGAEEVNEEVISPYKRIYFLLLGVVFGFFGIQFLYVKRYASFAIICTCAFITMIFAESTPAIGGLGSIVVFVSFLSSFFVGTDGKKRKMNWF